MLKINWPPKEGITYLGRNGIGRIIGLAISDYREFIALWPINSKKKLARCEIDIPTEAIPELIKALEAESGSTYLKDLEEAFLKSEAYAYACEGESMPVSDRDREAAKESLEDIRSGKKCRGDHHI